MCYRSCWDLESTWGDLGSIFSVGEGDLENFSCYLSIAQKTVREWNTLIRVISKVSNSLCHFWWNVHANTKSLAFLPPKAKFFLLGIWRNSKYSFKVWKNRHQNFWHENWIFVTHFKYLIKYPLPTLFKKVFKFPVWTYFYTDTSPYMAWWFLGSEIMNNKIQSREYKLVDLTTILKYKVNIANSNSTCKYTWSLNSPFLPLNSSNLDLLLNLFTSLYAQQFWMLPNCYSK